MSAKLKKAVKKEIEAGIEKKSDGRLLWLAKGWNNNFKEFISGFDEENKRGDTIYDKRNSLIHININQELGIKEDIVIKEFKLTRKYDKLRFCFLNSKAIRSLDIALALEKINVNTPKPIAVIEKRGKFNKIIYSYFVTEYIDYDYNLLDIVKDDNHPLRGEVINFLPQIAQDVRKMHEAGIVHNDLHAGNVLVDNIDENPKFYYIDLNRGRIKEKLSTKIKLKDLARFKLWPKEWEIFMKNYAPENHQDLLDLMIKQREKRKRFLNFRRKLKGIFRK
ncbi:lipopolysaccharide kinase InaA family protein [Selenihalanaerobacter shriftii]|uniref:Lipopolysaccharide kinase (Kdo/WaaP) family protein n=1 Tax=Selenihalanaerobacter shriftii TaxID=142842 RepID=A0A1T4KWJ3_9FIRM|nr:lipopolysaccharide kinase InaA family protein [Selenihalanaerobacter shriftii]SJZ46812.1 Lipopolysaccharide kinase (Kdo/WaaP) family protein [Selenihalanaerobacter shriftii]